MPRPTQSILLRLSTLLMLNLAPLVNGSLWESRNWALTGNLNGSAGYDPTPTVSHDGLGYAFVQASPSLTRARRDSNTDLRFEGGATTTIFVNNRLPAQTDLMLEAMYAYPAADSLIPLGRIDASWLRSAQPDVYLGERIRIEQLTGNTEGYLPVTGKLGVRGTINYIGKDYDSTALNQSRHGEAFLGLAYARDRRTGISSNFGAGLGSSQPNDPLRVADDVRSHEYYFTTRLQGQLTAKLSGHVFAGLGSVR